MANDFEVWKINNFREMKKSQLPNSLCYDYTTQKEYGELLLSLCFGSYVIREIRFDLLRRFKSKHEPGYKGYQSFKESSNSIGVVHLWVQTL